MGSRLAIYHPQRAVAFGGRPFGKDVANHDLFAALARHGGYDQIDILNHGGVSADTLAAELLGDSPSATRIATGHILAIGPAVEAGTLLRGKADLARLAWLRRRVADPRTFSLVGMIHTIAPPAVRAYMAEAATAPTEPWDALICTSPAVQSAMNAMFDDWAGYLADRFGGARRPKPALPLVPLGVDLASIAKAADDAGARAAVRAEFGLAEADVMALWVGRLSYFEKAFPQPMFRALQEAAQATGARVVFVLAGWFPGGEDDRARYEAAARAYAPGVDIHFVPGEDRTRVGGLWAGADMFVSLVDNIQETFGITPVEAMAAGLPVVVSDWDGYRYTVRDGVEGFLIPTLGGPPGQLGYAMASRHGLLLDSYQAYVGAVAQHTAVHVGRAAEAFAALIRSPDLRRTLGAAGRERVRTMFDWPVVVGELKRVFGGLEAMRRSAPLPRRPRWRLDPLSGDPFVDFAGFATTVIELSTPLRLRPGVDAADLERSADIELDTYGKGWRGTPAEARTALGLIESGQAATVGEVIAAFPPDRAWPVQLSLVWMAKLGLIDWLA